MLNSNNSNRKPWGATKVHLAEFNKKKKKPFVSRVVHKGKMLKERLKDLFKTFLFSSTTAIFFLDEFD